MFQVRPQQTQSMYTRDGVRLDADVYYPEAAGNFPVLLMRQPYGRAIASTVVYAHPRWYAAHGYIVVIQDVRGRGSSAGVFQLFAAEIADGADAVTWAAELPGSNGQVGMYGFSYQGMTQLYAAVEQPPALKTICPAMVAYDLYHDWAYEGDAFCLQTNLAWALQLAAETARRRGDEPAFLQLRQAAQHLPLDSAIPAYPPILHELAADSFYHDWIRRAKTDTYWQQLSPQTYGCQLAALPMLHIGGWFDPLLRGSWNLYQAMVEQSPHPQQMMVGPWAHLPWGRRVGEMDYGPDAVSPCDRLQLRWFDYWLKGIDNGILAEAPVRWFELGRNQWLWRDRWPSQEAQPLQLFLHSQGLSGIRYGQLAPEPPLLARSDVLVHDPWRPVPALGGHASLPAGVWERSALDGRSDILTYTSEPFAQECRLVGSALVSLHCHADTPSFDVCAILSDVHPNGSVYPIAQGYRHIAQLFALPITLALQPTCYSLPQGHALRLSLSAACFPAYPVNSGTGASVAIARSMEAQTITLTVETARDRPSGLQLWTLP